MTPEQRTKYATALLKNPVWEEAWIDLQRDMFAAFCENISLQDRERISLAMDLLADFRNKVEMKIQFDEPLKIVGDNNGN